MNNSSAAQVLLFAMPGTLSLVAGIAVLLLACRWRSSPSRAAFITFAAVSMIAMPIVDVVLSVYSQLSIQSGDYEVLQSLSLVQHAVLMILGMVSTVTLIAFAALHRNETYQSASLTPPTSRPVQVWNLATTPSEKIAIMRKREWAFLIDIAPLILAIAGILMSLAGANERRFGLLDVLQGILAIVVVLWIPYIVFKDSIQGASVGKRITGCRVVSRDSGCPVSVGESILRNVFFIVPLMWIVELIVALVRKDRRRLGDLAARTTVVQGDPESIDGDELVTATIADTVEKTPEPHPLDD